MKGYLWGISGAVFGFGFLVGLLFCNALIFKERSSHRIKQPATLIQWVDEDDDGILNDGERLVLPFNPTPFVLPPMPRFRPSPPEYNWQLPCP